MKAVVAEIKGKYAIVINKKGEFLKVRSNNKMKPGYEVDIFNNESYGMNSFVKIASVAAAFLMVIGLGSYGVYSYNAPYSFVSVDINPSIEITANRYDKITKAEAFNSDGEELLALCRVKNRNLRDGVADILGTAEDKGYFNNTGNAVVLSVSSVDERKSESIGNQVDQAAKNEFKTQNISAEVITEKVAIEKHTEANKAGISQGRLMLMEKLMAADPTLEAEEIKNLSVKDMVSIIVDDKQSDKDSINSSDKAGSNKDKNNGTDSENSSDKTGKDKTETGNNAGAAGKEGQTGQANGGNSNSQGGSQDKNNSNKIDKDNGNNKVQTSVKDNETAQNSNNGRSSSKRDRSRK